MKMGSPLSARIQEIEDLLERLKRFCEERNIPLFSIPEKLGIPIDTFRKWFYSEDSKNKRSPSAKWRKKIEDFLAGEEIVFPAETKVEEKLEDGGEKEEIYERVKKIKLILLLLEMELRKFQEGNREVRDILRQELDFKDVGYITSLLNMLGDEDRFQRWVEYTTNRFNFFRKKGGKNE